MSILTCTKSESENIDYGYEFALMIGASDQIGWSRSVPAPGQPHQLQA